MIRKSLRTLNRLQEGLLNNGSKNLWLGSVSIRLKIIIMVMVILAVSLIRSPIYLLIVGICLVAVLVTLPFKTIRQILTITWFFPFMTLLAILPAYLLGQEHSIWLPVKLWLDLIAVNLMMVSTKWHALTSVLKRWHVPDPVLLTLDMTFKYIYILSRRAQSLLYWLLKRDLGRNYSMKIMGAIFGSLFITAYEASEETYYAMQCRGYTGDYDD